MDSSVRVEPVTGGPLGRFTIDMWWTKAAESMFTELIVSRAARSLFNARWRTNADTLRDLPGTPVLHQRHASGQNEWILDFPPSGFALIEHEDQEVGVRVAAASDLEADRLMAHLRDAIPQAAAAAPSVRVSFWTLNAHGPNSTTMDLAATTWADVQRNYPATTGDTLARLLDEDWRPSAGRLLLWHGDPGTGKTHALRALMRAWKAWCSFHVVLDPEKFFGSSADYMMNVLLGNNDGFGEEASSPDADEARWRLLILEDTSELLSIDARDRAGQGLSRLLNLCDGLLGQSLKVLVLITTNEDFGKMHPAVVRPGRCLANVEFRCFDSTDAHRWLADHGITVPEKNLGATALAGLYSQLDGRNAPARDPGVGFL